MTALLEGYDLLIVLGIIALLFGGSQLPKLARALGSASHEFKRGASEGGTTDGGTHGAGTTESGTTEGASKEVEAKEASPT
ncbi:MAG: twin-arginine translocase TatA/TatE family subunit [Acidimicrobiales bacterium]|nr:twin-arginine translocase TatA/TatE family subunit [Acidimicrobiales bacterium]